MINWKCLCKKLVTFHMLLHKHKTIIFLGLIFLLYLIMSVGIIKYNTINEKSINFFGIDEYRVLQDMFSITGNNVNHYRTKVHPLFLLFVQPVLHIINGLVHDVGVTVAIAQSIVGITISFCTFCCLKALEVDKKTRVLLTAILTFSFSQIMFVSNAESFIWGGMATALCWFFSISQMKDAEGLFQGKLLALFLFLGLLCFGITITNYIHFVIALVFILRITSFSFKHKVYLFIKMNCLCLSIASLLNLMQFVSWRHKTELWLKQFYVVIVQKLLSAYEEFPEYIIPFYNEVSQLSFEEALYMDFTVSLSKVCVLIEQIFTSSILSRPLVMKELGANYHLVYFNGYYLHSAFLIFLFFGIFFLSYVYYLNKAMYSSHEYILLQMLTVALFLNLLLHFIYGAHEAFMYTPHFLFILFIIYGIISKYWNSELKRHINLFFVVFLVYEIMVNFYSYDVMRSFLIEHLSTPPYSMLNVSVGVLYIIFLFCILLYKCYKHKKSFFIKRAHYFFSVDAAYDLMLCFSFICILSMAFVCIKVFTEY